MIQLWRLLKFTLKVAIFFTLFAFALNNQHEATVFFFFGTHWSAPMVLIVLLAFASGLVIGVLGMVPRWWRERKNKPPANSDAGASPAAPVTQIPHGL
jgi:lipopolysaccharide assembly protein A